MYVIGNIAFSYMRNGLSVLFHTMARFYAIYRYVISIWRLIMPVEINQYDITMAPHYDIIMGNDIAVDVHCEITMGNGNFN